MPKDGWGQHAQSRLMEGGFRSPGLEMSGADKPSPGLRKEDPGGGIRAKGGKNMDR